MSELKARQVEKATARLRKPMLQKLGPDDDVEHFLAAFKRTAPQQGWPEEVWATQLADLLTGKALAAYAGLNGESAASYAEVKKAVFHHYDVRRRTVSDSGPTGSRQKNPSRTGGIVSGIILITGPRTRKCP